MHTYAVTINGIVAHRLCLCVKFYELQFNCARGGCSDIDALEKKIQDNKRKKKKQSAYMNESNGNCNVIITRLQSLAVAYCICVSNVHKCVRLA